MFKKKLKYFFKRNKFITTSLLKLLYLYLKLVYVTSRWQFIFSGNYNKEEFLTEQGAIFALWHNRLAFGPGIFRGHLDTHALVSPHSDGRVISSIIKSFGFGILEGSTNKNPVGALRQIIKKLASGSNIVITPDGPRGPVYKINSGITQIAKKYKTKLIPVSCVSKRYFLLKSWDKLMMPLPCSSIVVIIGEPLLLEGTEAETNNLLEVRLNELTKRAEGAT